MPFCRVPLEPSIFSKVKDTWYIYMGVQWFRGHVLQQCGIVPPQLLSLDSHSSHESLNLLTSAKANDIHLLALPPHTTHSNDIHLLALPQHTTHWMNPLDRTSFGPFQR